MSRLISLFRFDKQQIWKSKKMPNADRKRLAAPLFSNAYVCRFWLYWSRVNHSTCGYDVQICKASGRPSEEMFSDHHFDKAIFPTTHSPLRSGKMAPSCPHSAICTHIDLSSSSSSSSPYQAPSFLPLFFSGKSVWWAVKIGPPIFCVRLS